MPRNKTNLIHENPIKLLSNSNSSSKRVQKISKIKKFFKARLPILKWIGGYNTQWAINDFIAGITLGLTIIPESIACALLAGLPARYGLCSAFIGSFIYLFFGSIHKVIMGPTSLVALVSLQFTVGKPVEFAFLLTFLSGVVEMICGCLQIGLIFEFISLPVIKAFSSATAVLVIESQIKVLLGIKYLVSGLLDSMRTLILRIHEASIGDLVMGFGSIAFLIAVDQIEKLSQRRNVTKFQRLFFLYLSFSRNTLIVLITGVISYVWLHETGQVPYALSENSLAGLPKFSWPSLMVSSTERDYNFWDILKELNVGIIVIPIVGILTNFSIGKISPNEFNLNQELVTVGICNIFGSCVQSMPTSGAFSRCAISTACGLKTPMANLYSGIIVLLALSYVSNYFNYIPKAALAAILICSIYTLIDLKLPRRLWQQSRREFAIWLICFFVCILFGVEVGLLISIIITLFHLLFVWARPEIKVQIEELANIKFVRITPGTAIYFPATSFLREKVLKAYKRLDRCNAVVIDCLNIFNLDYTAAKIISKLANELVSQSNEENTNCLLILYRLNSSLHNLIDLHENLTICNNGECLCDCILRSALRRNGDDDEKQMKLLNLEEFESQVHIEGD